MEGAREHIGIDTGRYGLAVDLYLGDSLEIMPHLEGVDAIITDPPYGVGITYEGVPGYLDTVEEAKALLSEFIPLAQRVCQGPILFPSTRFSIETWLYQNFPPRWRLCWYKGAQSTASPVGFSDFELIFVYGDDIYRRVHDFFAVKPVTLKAGDRDPASRIHPCPKSLGWARWLVDHFTDEGGTVLDPFMGSGVVGEAAIRMGRNFIGIDLSEVYFRAAAERLRGAVLQQPLLVMKPAPSQDSLL